MGTFLHHSIGTPCLALDKQNEFAVGDVPVRVIGVQLPASANIAVEQWLEAPCVTKVSNGVAVCGSAPRGYWVPLGSSCGAVVLSQASNEVLVYHKGNYRINTATLPAGAFAVWAGEAPNIKGRVGVSVSAAPCPGAEPLCDVTAPLGVTGWSP